MTNSRASRFRVDILFDETASRGGSCQGTPTADADSLRRRLMFCAAGLLSVFVILSMRTTQLALSSPPPRFALSDEALEDSAPVLEDSAGRALALTTRRNGLAVNGAEVWDAEETAKALGAIFPGVDTVTLEARLASRRRVLLKRVITEAEKDDALSLGLPGLSFPETEVRAYPQGRLFSHVVGYQIPGSGGVTGLEAMATREGLTGPVKTTLNVTAQTIILAELAKAQRTYGAAAAWAVLMHADTGAVAAMASLPDFDPNSPGASSPDARRNRVVSDNYELGSAFKPLTIAMALEDGLARLDTPIDVAPPLRVGDWAIRDYSDKGPVLTTEDVLAYSSNIGTAQLALLLGQERFLTALDSFGLIEPLVTALPESRRPALPQAWGDAELATISYGHGIALSPLHLVTSFAAVV
ncbi:MAG: penicillin-binding transpeptidase domain-containing protein, partial [Pseudomonadota bacterium]